MPLVVLRHDKRFGYLDRTDPIIYGAKAKPESWYARQCLSRGIRPPTKDKGKLSRWCRGPEMIVFGNSSFSEMPVPRWAGDRPWFLLICPAFDTPFTTERFRARYKGIYDPFLRAYQICGHGKDRKTIAVQAVKDAVNLVHWADEQITLYFDYQLEAGPERRAKAFCEELSRHENIALPSLSDAPSLEKLPFATERENVNHLRHGYSDYDYWCSKEQTPFSRWMLFVRVNREIGKRYPELAFECEIQIEEKYEERKQLEVHAHV